MIFSPKCKSIREVVYRGTVLIISVADPDPFDADPDPAFRFDTDPDPAFQFDLDPTV